MKKEKNEKNEHFYKTHIFYPHTKTLQVLIVRAFRGRIEQHVTTLYGDRARQYEYFL
jgi:hypothetical protein